MYYWLITLSVCLFVWLMSLLSSYIKLLDRPEKYADTRWRKPIPTLQWVRLYLWFVLLSSLFFFDSFLNEKFWFLFLFALPLIIVATLDDVFFEKISIPTWLRFLLQIICAWWCIYFADLWIEQFSLWAFVFDFWYWWWKILAMLRFILCINAINWFDWISWQASGVATIGFATIYFLISFVVFPTYISMTDQYIADLTLVQEMSALFALFALMYAILERKPWWLVRDPWTFFYWFWLAYLSLLVWIKIWTMLVVLSLVVFDAIWVCLHRIFVLKTKPWKWDYTHLHHRLLWLWRTKKEVNVFVRVWSCVMMILMLLQWDNRMSKIIIFIMMALLFFGINAYIFRYKKLPCGLGVSIR